MALQQLGDIAFPAQYLESPDLPVFQLGIIIDKADDLISAQWIPLHLLRRYASVVSGTVDEDGLPVIILILHDSVNDLIQYPENEAAP